MGGADDDDEATQQTPAGAEIPVPEREDVMAALRKAARAAPDEQEPPETG
ncbi:MAG: hypothetical protein M3451_07010 [Chloroflexota bacterium]|nr:hypothetical protein [Chloroflexota bacterium]